MKTLLDFLTYKFFQCDTSHFLSDRFLAKKCHSHYLSDRFFKNSEASHYNFGTFLPENRGSHYLSEVVFCLKMYFLGFLDSSLKILIVRNAVFARFLRHFDSENVRKMVTMIVRMAKNGEKTSKNRHFDSENRHYNIFYSENYNTLYKCRNQLKNNMIIKIFEVFLRSLKVFGEQFGGYVNTLKNFESVHLKCFVYLAFRKILKFGEHFALFESVHLKCFVYLAFK